VQTISEIIKTKKLTPDRRNSNEFQAYGNLLAEELCDTQHRALYIKLAKTESRALLEIAREHVKASTRATTRGRLFMWKLTQLKQLKQTQK
jgi:hypothetical protein